MGDTGVAWLRVMPTACEVIALVRLQPAGACVRLAIGAGTTGMAAGVDWSAIESCRLIPVTAMVIGIPRPSAAMRRFDPRFRGAVGMVPLSWPAGSGNIDHTKARPLPINLVMRTQRPGIAGCNGFNTPRTCHTGNSRQHVMSLY